MKKVIVIIFIVVLTIVAALFQVNLKPAVAIGSEETLSASIVIKPTTGIKGVTDDLYRSIKNEGDYKVWNPTIQSVEWFTGAFLGESPEAIKEGLETYLISEEALDAFVAVAAVNIDRSIRNYIAENNHQGSSWGGGVETFKRELRSAVDIDAAVNKIYASLKPSASNDSELLKRYYMFRRQRPGLDPPLEMFLIIGELARAFVKSDSEYSDILELLKGLLTLENQYQTEKIAFQNVLKNGIRQMRSGFNTRLRSMLDTIAERLTQY